MKAISTFSLALLVAFNSQMAAAQSGSGQRGSGTAQPNSQQPQAQPAGPGSASKGSSTVSSAAGLTMESGSATRSNVPVAMRGFCPVCLVEMRRWVPGAPRFATIYDGKQYRFPDARRLQMFRADPTKYVAALGGDCVVHFMQTGQRVPGSLQHGAVHGGRIFFMASQEHRQMFLDSPAMYGDADLVLGGDCVVCRVNMNQKMPGTPQLTSIHNGMRFRFAGLQQQQMFAGDPGRYLPAAMNSRRMDGSNTRDGSDKRDGSSRRNGSGVKPGDSVRKSAGSGSANR